MCEKLGFFDDVCLLLFVRRREMIDSTFFKTKKNLLLSLCELFVVKLGGGDDDYV